MWLPVYLVQEKRKQKLNPHDQHYPVLRVFTSPLIPILIRRYAYGYGDYLAVHPYSILYTWGIGLAVTRALGQIVASYYRAASRVRTLSELWVWEWVKRAEKGESGWLNCGYIGSVWSMYTPQDNATITYFTS